MKNTNLIILGALVILAILGINLFFASDDTSTRTVAGSEYNADQFDTTATEGNTFGEQVGDAIDGTVDAVSDAGEATGDAISDAAEATGDMAKDAADATADAAGSAYDATTRSGRQRCRRNG